MSSPHTHLPPEAQQPALFATSPDERVPDAAPSRAPNTPPPPPTPTHPAEALLIEIEHDWWSLLDLRNWRERGPTDTEILARYRAIGTPSYDDWPNVSGSRMYNLVWPSLRCTHHVPENTVLLACQRTLMAHLSQAVDDQRTNAVRYSIIDDLMTSHSWNGDSLASYHAICQFSKTDPAPFPVLIQEGLTLKQLSLAASLLETKAQILRLTAKRTLHKHEKDSIAFLTKQLAEHRTALAECARARRAKDAGRFFLERATIGPRFNDPTWATLKEGDPLPAPLIDQLLTDSQVISTSNANLPITKAAQ